MEENEEMNYRAKTMMRNVSLIIDVIIYVLFHKEII